MIKLISKEHNQLNQSKSKVWNISLNLLIWVNIMMTRNTEDSTGLFNIAQLVKRFQIRQSENRLLYKKFISILYSEYWNRRIGKKPHCISSSVNLVAGHTTTRAFIAKLSSNIFLHHLNTWQTSQITKNSIKMKV